MNRVGQNHKYIRRIHGIFGREITKYTAIYIVYIRREQLTPQMRVFSKCSQSMRAHVCCCQTWLQRVAHAAAGEVEFQCSPNVPRVCGPTFATVKLLAPKGKTAAAGQLSFIV